ncbi:hypothetical protein ACLHWT_06240 [Flavobacterium psychrophilum]|uniref:hypothetical protein n=1 Tax=Flavobacterium psychrophilum TaxID=96345 RepID=UPI003984EC0B
MRIIVVFLFAFNVVFAQNNYPKDYFRSPLDIPLAIAGSFGELNPIIFILVSILEPKKKKVSLFMLLPMVLFHVLKFLLAVTGNLFI